MLTIKISPSFSYWHKPLSNLYEGGLTIHFFDDDEKSTVGSSYKLEITFECLPIPESIPAVPIDKVDSDLLVRTLKKVKVYPLGDFRRGLDGTSFYLAIEQGPTKAEFTWWSKLPKQWQMFRAIFTEMSFLLHKTFPSYNFQLLPESEVDPEGAINERYIVCLECGSNFRSLTEKHVASHFLTLDEYREKWGYDKDTCLAAKHTSKPNN